MVSEQLDDLLKDHKLRNTQNRAAILDVFVKHESALSHADIEERLGEAIDRVTIYRTLKSFLDHGLIHKVLDDEGGAKYAFCRDECDAHSHHHNHVHFKCTQCGQTQCIEDLGIPEMKLPAGFQPKEMDLLIQGLCPNCSEG